MRSLGQVLSTKYKTLNTEVLSTSGMTSVQIRNRALGIADGLVSTDPPHDYTGWYCKAYKTLGEGRYSAIAAMARRPGVNNPRTLFGHLLREELSLVRS